MTQHQIKKIGDWMMTNTDVPVEKIVELQDFIRFETIRPMHPNNERTAKNVNTPTADALRNAGIKIAPAPGSKESFFRCYEKDGRSVAVCTNEKESRFEICQPESNSQIFIRFESGEVFEIAQISDPARFDRVSQLITKALKSRDRCLAPSVFLLNKNRKIIDTVTD